MPTETDKQRAIEAIQSLPDHATIEDAIERLYFIAKIEAGLRDSEPIAEIVPASRPAGGKRRLGMFAETGRVVADIVTLSPEP